MFDNSWVPYVDSFGLITQRDKDGGDTAHKSGIYLTCKRAIGEQDSEYYLKVMKYLEVKPGVFRRHPDLIKWYSNTNNFSRDQMSMIEICCAIHNDRGTLKAIIKRLVLRCFFHQNYHHGTDVRKNSWKIPDIVSPGEIATWIRGLDLKVLYPFLYLLDLRFMFDLYFRKKNFWDYDVLLGVNFILAHHKKPTMFSKFFFKKWLNTDCKHRIKTYFSKTPNDVAPLGELYIKAIESIS